MKDGTIHQTQSLEVLKDPNSEGGIDDIRMQSELLDKIKSDYGEISKEVNKAERIRRQLRDLKSILTEETKALDKEVSAVDSTVTELENKMMQLKHTGRGQDMIRLPGMLLEKLSYLSSAAGTADFRPADQHMAVFNQLHGEWEAVKKEWQECLAGPVKKLVSTLQEKEVGTLIVPK